MTSSSYEYKYRDKTVPVDERVDDLLSRMTLAEKSGQLFHNMIPMGPGGMLSDANPAFGVDSTRVLVTEKLMSHFNLIGPVDDPVVTARWYNDLQRYVLENTRLGIPVTLSTDPRSHFTDNVGTAFNAGSMSQWPETLGLAAIRDAKLVERFADIARQEYLALGLRVALHPQADLATEPRWARANTTYGEDAELSGELTAAYIRGFQGTHVGPESVSCMTKHFPGGGPQKDGEDPHFAYGKDQVYPAGRFEYHLAPFRQAIAAGTSQMMPYYGRPVGLELDGEKIEEVGFAFNKQLISGLLRDKLGYTGIVCTDWGLLTDTNILGQDMPARAWGCEHLTPVERAVKILEAGCDQFGGEACPALVIEAVESNMVSMDVVDRCVRRVLKEKFVLGLFDNPFVQAERAGEIVGREDFVREGEGAQRRAYTLLKNEGNILPLHIPDGGIKIYAEGFDGKKFQARDSRIQIVSAAHEADVALLRLKAPFEPRPGGFEAFFHAGSLEFSAEEKARQAEIFGSTKAIVDLYLDRPAVVPEIAENAAALLCSYGSNLNAFLDIVLGSAKPQGKLPFDLPRSMDAVQNSREDAAYDTENPVFKFGHGLTYQ